MCIDEYASSFLLESGTSIRIESKTFSSNNLLKIVGRSRCLEKPKYIIDAMMKARVQHNINKCNLDELAFTSLPKGFCTKVELSKQEEEFVTLAHEISQDVMEEHSTVQILLKHSPESLKYLFDKCLVKPVPCQMQGEIFFDFILFEANKKGMNESNYKSL